MAIGHTSFRGLLTAALIAGAATGLAATSAAAQDSFPSKPITLIVPWSAGGGSDTSMRLVAEAAEKTLGQPVVVVNKPGAGGAEGTRAIEQAEPDGYTIGMVGSGVIARHYGNPNATDFHDLTPIAFFGADPGALTANPSTGFKTVEDFVKAAKEKPGSVTNGNDQPGGASYITAAVIENDLGVELTKVPYEGFAPTTAALLAGEVQTATVPIPDVIEHQMSGDLVILGVTDTDRHFLAPDVPTFQEQGFDVVIGSWRIIVGPKGIPADRFAILEKGLLDAMSDPEFIKKANAAGFGVAPKGAADTGAFLESYDETLYPVLLSADLVKTRKK
ncbi:Bug family tripartite tricarboxylate transporter substrate binding protein [Amorphus sp. MBR-141]